MKNLGYSQNFLVNKKLVERLISKSNIDVTDYVIEIGPGKGIITDVLSQHAGEVVAVEYDQELYNNLVRYHSHDNVTYIFGDFLKYKLPLNRRYKIFSNIPFQITADIIRPLINDFLRKMAKFRHQENQDVSAGTRIRFFIDKPAAMISFPRAVIKYL